MSDLRAAAQQALEALEDIFGANKVDVGAINAIRAALAEPQMQPCAGRNCGSTNPNLHSAECFEDYEKSTGMNQWHGLTNDEIEHIADSEWEEAFVRMIEAKLKEKNT